MNIKENYQVRSISSMIRKKLGVTVNQRLAEEWHKLVTKKFKRQKVYERFKGNIYAADSAEIGPLSSKKKNVNYLLCVIYLFTKYAWGKYLKHKKSKTFLNDFITIVYYSNCNSNKLRVDQGK